MTPKADHYPKDDQIPLDLGQEAVNAEAVRTVTTESGQTVVIEDHDKLGSARPSEHFRGKSFLGLVRDTPDNTYEERYR